MPGTEQKESPTDFLIRSLEQIEGAEDCVVVFRRVENGKDVIDWLANDVPAWKMAGMLNWAAQDAYQEAASDED